MIELRQCTNKEEWDDYQLEHGGHPLQLWAWGQVKAGHGWIAERLFAVDDERIVGAAQVLTKPLPLPLRAFSYIPRGPLAEDEHLPAFLQILAERVKREHHSVTLSVELDRVEFEAPDGWIRATNKVLSAETILLDLTLSESDLLADMAKKTRQYIRKSATEIHVKHVQTQEELESCLAIYGQTAKRAGFNTHSEQYYRDVFTQLDDHSPVFVALHDGQPVAFLWLAVSGMTAYELYGGMTEKGQEIRANYALKWHAIRKAKEWGLERYDFGGLVAGGVATFKQGWSSEPFEFSGTYDKPLSPLYVLWSKGLPFAKRIVQRIKR